MSEENRYSRIIEALFFTFYVPGSTYVDFVRGDLETMAQQAGLLLPKNIGDIIYSFKYRASFPATIMATAPEGKQWIIRNIGRSKYRFELMNAIEIRPSELLIKIKIPDATPKLVEMYAFNDEQALLARIRYNRLIDIFTGTTCYSLQNHLRTTVDQIGQIETDELYVGVNRAGAHFVFPVQAKMGTDRLGLTQIHQDIALCRAKFPALICRPVGAVTLRRDQIALFEFAETEEGIGIVREVQYQLVSGEDISADDLMQYRLLSES